MALQANVLFGVNGQYSLAGQLGTKLAQLGVNLNLAFLDGVGAGQVSKIYARKAGSLGSQVQSVNTDLDLSGSLVDDLGQTVVFTAVKAIVFGTDALNPGTLSLGPAPANGFAGPFSGTTPALVLPALCAGRVAFARFDATGWAVTAGTGDLLRIASAATAGTYNYDLAILGI